MSTPTKPRYKDALKQRFYADLLTLAADRASELYHNGRPRGRGEAQGDARGRSGPPGCKVVAQDYDLETGFETVSRPLKREMLDAAARITRAVDS